MEENMRRLIAYAMSRLVTAAVIGALVSGVSVSARANVITEWDEKAIAATTPLANFGVGTTPYMAQRMMAMVHAAMFDAVNSIERRYRPYLVQLPTEPSTSVEAAAATAAAAVLSTIDPNTAAELKVALATYLASIPDGAGKSDGVKLGEAVAAKIVAARTNDGCDAPDDYRPKTAPGVYIPTSITLASTWPKMKPFVLINGFQFRPSAPISLESQEWATDYNELKDYGGQTGAKRTAEQTETALFWLMGPPMAYHPFARQLVIAKKMSVIDSARFMTLTAVGLADAIIAVLDAKYYYNFWRPITAIRNGDIDDNPATEREATWQPIAPTPMHPEYPCAHCAQSGTVAGVVKAVLGTTEIPEIAVTSPTAPGVTHRWSNMTNFTEEIANARIWAGFHYRFSTRVGTQMGLQIGEYIAKNAMHPVGTGTQ
jgi:hypothetical protein